MKHAFPRFRFVGVVCLMPAVSFTWPASADETASADAWTGDDRVCTDPGMRRMWERLMVEVSPDGAVVPYGPNAGWNSSAAFRVAMLERVTAATGDGRNRFVAHKLFNQLRYLGPEPASGRIAVDPAQAWLISLAWLFADDSVATVEPAAGSGADPRALERPASRHPLRGDILPGHAEATSASVPVRNPDGLPVALTQRDVPTRPTFGPIPRGDR